MSDLDNSKDSEWRRMLIEGDNIPHTGRRLLGLLPSNPRCKLCNAPFKSWGGSLMRVFGRPQSRKNPRYCEPCAFQEPGGAEVELSMLFADIRGSTTIAERMRPAEFTRLISRFYEEATLTLIETDALIDRLVGDEVIGLYIPGIAGPDHAVHAILAARKLIQRLGYGAASGPWLPVGVGVHTGIAFVGVIQAGAEKVSDFTALGDNVNITARLASAAAPGEILVSAATVSAAGLDTKSLEFRQLELKGKSESIGVYVLRG
jgi:adenylate cyclase